MEHNLPSDPTKLTVILKCHRPLRHATTFEYGAGMHGFHFQNASFISLIMIGNRIESWEQPLARRAWAQPKETLRAKPRTESLRRSRSNLYRLGYVA
jgi:hypothetical protein